MGTTLASSIAGNVVLVQFLIGALLGGLFATATQKPVTATCVLACIAALLGNLMWISQCETAEVCLAFALETATSAMTWMLEKAVILLGWGVGYGSARIAGGKGGRGRAA
jgi:hypothetical protein